MGRKDKGGKKALDLASAYGASLRPPNNSSLAHRIY
jgi:hypothetical protein